MGLVDNQRQASAAGSRFLFVETAQKNCPGLVGNFHLNFGQPLILNNHL